MTSRVKLYTSKTMENVTLLFAVIIKILVYTSIQYCDCVPLPSLYTTKSCPKNEIEWKKRSEALKCSKERGYMCLPNAQFTELVELCHIYPQITLIAAVCPFLNTETYFVDEYECDNFIDGCPASAYTSNQIYKYPQCLSIGNGCFLAEPSCNRSIYLTHKPPNIATTTFVTETIGNKQSKENLTEYGTCYVITRAQQMIFLVVSLIICLWRFRRKIRRCICKCICETERQNPSSMENPSDEPKEPIQGKIGYERINSKEDKFNRNLPLPKHVHYYEQFIPQSFP